MKPRFVVCIRNSNYKASLEVGKIYRVLPDAKGEEHRLLRIIDESGEDYLYPKKYFVPIEVPEPVERILIAAS
jgi:hypothetical protein